jgi:hypothetical protein
MSFPKSSSLKSLSLYHGPPCLWFFLSYLTRTTGLFLQLYIIHVSNPCSPENQFCSKCNPLSPQSS